MISIERDGAVAVLRMEHGKVNAQDAELLAAVSEGVDELAGGGAPPLVITGAGRAFSAGVDLNRFLEGGPAYVDRLIPALTGAFEAVFTYPGPTVAAVNGAAIAGGCILACACDRRLLAAGARIGASELLVGVAFPVAAVEILRHACGDHAEEVILTGRLYEGEGAVATGIGHEVVDPDALEARAREVAAELGAAAHAPFRLAKAQLRRPVLERIATDGPRVDAEVTALWASEETAATVRAYLERTVRR